MVREETPEVILKRHRLLAKHNIARGSFIFYEGAQREIIGIQKNYTLCIGSMIYSNAYVDPLDIIK